MTAAVAPFWLAGWGPYAPGTFRLNGVNGVIALDTTSDAELDLTSYTLLTWVWPDSTAVVNDNRIFNKASGINVGAMQLNISGSVTAVRVRQNSGVRVTSTGFLTADAWNCVAMTQDAAETSPRAWRYTSGTAATEATYASTTARSGAVDPVTASSLLYGNTDDSSRPWKGNLGPAALYNRVLTPQEMYDFQRGVVPAAGLVRLWTVDSQAQTLVERTKAAPVTLSGGVTYDQSRYLGVEYATIRTAETELLAPAALGAATGDVTTAATELLAPAALDAATGNVTYDTVTIITEPAVAATVEATAPLLAPAALGAAATAITVRTGASSLLAPAVLSAAGTRTTTGSRVLAAPALLTTAATRTTTAAAGLLAPALLASSIRLGLPLASVLLAPGVLSATAIQRAIARLKATTDLTVPAGWVAVPSGSLWSVLADVDDATYVTVSA